MFVSVVPDYSFSTKISNLSNRIRKRIDYLNPNIIGKIKTIKTVQSAYTGR